MEACHVEAEDVYTYSAGGPNVKITFNGVILKNGVDYKVNAKYDKKTATDTDIECTYTISGIGNFKGKIKEKYKARVKYAGLDDCAIYLPNIPQGKKNIKPMIFDAEGFELKANRDYTFTFDKEATKNLGADVVYTIKGKGYFKGEAKEVTTVVPSSQDIGKAKIVVRDKLYNGGEYLIDSETDFVAAVLGDKKLDLDYMFVVRPQYISNIRPGKYKAYIMGKGPLGGIKKVKYTVK